jgi:hypothetical protein
MKRPKQLTLCGKKCKVIYDKKRSDGSCDLATMTMTIGTEVPSDILELLIHESLEAIMLLRGNRYQCYADGNDKLKFVMDHSEMENVVKDLVVVVEVLK